jgi:prepilin-type N-terminal cleavage/methylation domain-containing protein
MLKVKLMKSHKMGIIRDQRGFSLIEVLIALAMAGVIIAGVLMVMGTSTKILVLAKNQEISKDIAASEMEYIRSIPYAGSYDLSGMPPLPANYDNYTSTVNVTYLEMDEQKIEIEIYWNGTMIFPLTDYRTNF